MSPAPADGARVAEAFVRIHRRQPSGVFAAPGRVNLIGEHTDYNDGWCLPVALPHATYVAVAPRGDGQVSIVSLQQDQPFHSRIDELTAGSIKGWGAYAAGVLWALRESGLPLPGMDLLVDSEVPVGAGLSSSAALECAVALAASSVADDAANAPTIQHLIRACMRAEREVAGAPTGGMDQTVSMLAESGSALLIDCHDWTTEQVPWPASGDGVRLLVVDTRVSHALSDGQYADRRSICEAAARHLALDSLREVVDLDEALARLPDGVMRRRVRHVYSENERVHGVVTSLRAGDFARVGEHFDASHASLRDDYQVSCAELDVVVESAQRAGALGARMTGGGFGGSAVVLADASLVPVIERSVSEAFAARGWAAPRFLAAVPSGGARQVPHPPAAE